MAQRNPKRRSGKVAGPEHTPAGKPGAAARRAQAKVKQEPPLRQQAYERLHMEIVTFGLRPGEVVSELALSQRFDLGIAAVRAALLRLSQDGLVIAQRRRGHTIAPITVQDLKQIYFLRSCLEPAAAELAVGRVDTALLRKLDRQSSIKTQGADRRAELRSLEGNHAFHIAIAAATGNARLLQWVQQLHDLSFRFQYLLRHSEVDGEHWGSSHESLIKAFENRDAAQARACMAEHVAEGQELTMRMLMDRPEVQSAQMFANI